MKFDDLSPALQAALSRIPVPYKGINFSAFGLEDPGIPLFLNQIDDLLNGVFLPWVIPDGLATSPILDGVVPNTGSIYLVNGPRRRLTQGPPNFNIVGTDTKSFALISFYFGCLLNTEAQQVQVAMSCDIKVTGVKKDNGGVVGPKTFTFAKTKLNVSPMALASSFGNNFTDLMQVNIEIVTAPLLVTLVVDTVKVVTS